MRAEVKELAYSPYLWLVTITAIVLVLILATYYLIKSIKTAKEMGISQKRINDAMKTSAIAAVGPTLVICVGMISLLVMVGAPTAWMRLSVIGDIAQELLAVSITTDAYGTASTADAITPQMFQTIVFIMAGACTGYLLIPVFFVNKLDGFIKKISASGGAATTGLIATAAVLGSYGYVEAPYLLAMNAGTVALVSGFVAMHVLQWVQVKFNQEWLIAWGMIIAMFIGMAAGAIAA